MQNFGSRTAADEVLKDRDLSGRNILVTGANTGIGYEAARSLAAAGAHVIFACRSEQKGLAAIERAQLSDPSCSIQFIQLDLSSFDNIKRFCDNFPLDSLDVILCNAGLFASQFEETENGIEKTVGVCHFGHFLLTQLLMDKLLKTEKPRVIMVSSESHRSPKKLNFEKFPLQRDQFSAFIAYGQAKLCNVLFANELQRRYASQGLSACSLHPGTLITTDIGRNSGIVSVFMKIISPLTKTPNQGASTSVFCAVYESEKNIAGKYFSHCKETPSTSEANNSEVAKKLWELSEAQCRSYL